MILEAFIKQLRILYKYDLYVLPIERRGRS